MRNIVIVGSTGDIGQAIHQNYKDENVISFSHQTASKFSHPHHFINLKAPLLESEIETYFKNYKHVDALIYTPGVTLFKMIQDTSLDEVDALYNMYVRNLIAFIKVLLPKLKLSNHGRIIVVTSIYGRVGASCESIYSMMKGAEETLIKSLAKEYALTNITINGVAPGVVQGNMTNELSEIDKNNLLHELPQGRFIQTYEITHTVEYLMSKHAKSVSGEILNVNGGWLS